MQCKGISTPRSSGDGEVKEEGMEESITPASTVSQTNTNNIPSLSSSIASSATEAVCHENVIDCVHVTKYVTESGVSHVPYTVDLVRSAQIVSDDSSRNLEKSSENVTNPCATAQRITECVGVEKCVHGVKDLIATQCAADSETMKLNISDTIITTGVTQSSSVQSVTLTDSVFTQSVLTDSTVHVTQSVTDPVDVVQNVSDSIKSRDNSVAAVIEETSVSVLNSSLDSINACDSAVDTDDYCQDYLVIDPKDIKEEVDSDAEDTVDGNLTHHLRHSDISKVESDSNSSCSLNSSYGSGCWIGESIATRGERLYRNLSNSFPGTALTRMLRSMEDTQSLDSEDEDMTPSAEKLSWSWSGPGSIHKEGDDELTPLTWLQDADLLKNINADVEIEPVSEEQKENKDGQKNGDACAGGLVSGQTNLHNVQYNPVKNVNAKPPFSFSCLIFMAIENSPGKKLPVKEIYNWILANFPYYENAANGWKNSVRHNLSLNKCFKKVEKDKGANLGKGAFWCIDPEYRPNLLQALRKTPYHPYRQLQMMSTAAPQQQLQRVQGLPGGFRPMPLAQRALPNTVSPHLFPFLSRKMAQTAQTASNEKDYHAANALVELHSYSSGLSSDGSDASGPTSPRSGMKRKTLGPPKRQGPFIIIPPPSADHNYSSATILEADAPSRPSSIDEGYDFGDDDDDVSELSDYPSDWDEDNGDEVDGDIPEGPAHKKLKVDLKSKKQVAQKPEVDTPFASDLLSAADLLMSFKESGRLSYSGEEKSSPRKSSSSSSKARSSTAQITRSSSSSPKRRASLASASKSSSLSSSQSSTSSSSSNKSSSQSALSSRLSQKKIKSRTSLKSKAKASKTSASSKTVGATVTKSARHSVESTGATVPKSQKDSSSAVTGATVSKSTKDTPSRPPNKNDFKTPPSTKCLSSSRTSTKSSCSSSKTKASIIMTRREKAAAAAETASKMAVTASKVAETVAETVTKTAEQAVEKVQSAHSMRTRGKKLNFKKY